MDFIRLVPKKYTVALQCNVIKSDCVILRHGHIAITNYHMGDNKEFEKCLSTWDKMYFKYDLIGGYYVKKLKEFRINRGFNLLMLKRFFPHHEFKVDNNAYPCDKIDVKLYAAPRDDFQKVALTFMANQGEFRKNLAYTQQLITAQTGAGKAIPDDAMIPTPDGLRRMDEIKEGDYVYNINRQPTKVLKVYPQGIQETYKLTFDDGRTARCNLEHLWYVICNGEPVVAPLYSLMWPEASNEDIYIPCPAENKNIRIVNIEQIEDLPQRCILIDDPLHVYLTENDIPTHNTYCGTSSTAFLSARTLVVVPISILLKQWKESYLNFTSLEEEDILIVQGSKKCEKILEGKYKDVKVFLVMVDTLLAFHKTHGDMETIELLRSMNCYTKIVDEVHRDMKSLSVIEALSNFRMNYYLSASPGRSDRKEDWIFSNLFMNMPKFGGDFRTDSEKHINVLIKKYRFTPMPNQIKQMYRPNVGLNSNSYEKVLLNAEPYQKQDFIDSVETIFAWTKKMLKKKNKILFMCNTVDGTGIIKDIAEKIYPGDCSRYYSTGLSKKEKEKALQSKVIIATQSSVGTGTDIPGIQFVLNMTTYSSKINSTQLPGRARALKDGTPVMYIEFVNVAYQATYRQFEKRKPYLKNNAKDNRIMMVD